MSANTHGDLGTVGGELMQPPTLSETQLSAKLLSQDAGAVRGEVRDLSSRTDDMHRSTQVSEWRTRTADRGKASHVDLLGELAELGFAWRDVAQMVGVSVPAIQKWRRGERITGENRRKLAGLLAACDQVTEDYLVSDVASWFEMPLVDTAPTTPADLYASERTDLVLDYASGHSDPEAVMDEFDAEWREKYRARFESFTAPDGEKSLRMKEQ